MERIVIESDFLNKIDGLSWADVCFAYKRGLIDQSGVISFAMKKVQESSNFSSFELEMAALTEKSPKNLVDGILFQIFSSRLGEVCNYDRLLYVTLLWLFIYRDKFLDVKETIQSLWSDFEYNESIRCLDKYASFEQSGYGMISFIDQWKEYLRTSEFRSIYLGNLDAVFESSDLSK